MSIFVRYCAAFAVVSGYCQSPIENLSTNYSASDIYFTASLVQRDSGQSGFPKVFLLRGKSLTLIAESPALSSITGYRYSRTGLDASGSVRAINRRSDCIGGSSCIFRELAGTRIETPSGRFEFSGFAAIANNGKFAVLYGRTNGAPGTPRPARSLERVDLSTGIATSLGTEPANSGHLIAEDGTVVVTRDGGLRLLGPNKSIDLTAARQWNRVVLASDATRIIYDTSNPAEIRVLDSASNRDRAIGPGQLPMLAADGRTFSYLTESAELWIGDAVSGSTRRLLATPEGIADQTLSGDGATVIAATRTGRLLSINTFTGAATQLLDASGPYAYLLAPPSPGGYNELRGSFPPDFQPDLRLGEEPIVLLGRTQSGFAFQVPWEAQPGSSAKVILHLPEIAWEPALNATVRPYGSVILAAVHEDWSSLITPDGSPARPGEIIHLIGAGYGPIDGVIESGQPTPRTRLYRMTAACDWRAIGNAASPPRAIEAPFAGLAPGLIGIYQLDLRIPEDWPHALFNAYCQFSTLNFLPTKAIEVKQ